jgi:hypothetical protein
MIILNIEFVMMHVDEIIDKLLHEERVFDVALPRIMKRQVLEDLGLLGPRISFLEEEIQESAEEEPSEDKEKKTEKWRQEAEVVAKIGETGVVTEEIDVAEADPGKEEGKMILVRPNSTK